jgi:mono/diheme cytochrome c family protein
VRLRVVLLVVLGLAAVALLAAGCGGDDDTSGDTTTVTTETTDTTDTETTETTTEEGSGTGDAAAGEAVFASAGCGSCHTLSAAGSTGTVGPNLDDAQPSADLVVERVTNGMGAMPSFSDQLTEQQILDVAAYVSSSAGS